MSRIKIKESDFFEAKKVTSEETIIAVSDMHLGFIDKSQDPIAIQFNKQDIKSFFEQIRDGVIQCNRLIICGDFFDMWRRYFAGIFI